MHLKMSDNPFDALAGLSGCFPQSEGNSTKLQLPICPEANDSHGKQHSPASAPQKHAMRQPAHAKSLNSARKQFSKAKHTNKNRSSKKPALASSQDIPTVQGNKIRGVSGFQTGTGIGKCMLLAAVPMLLLTCLLTGLLMIWTPEGLGKASLVFYMACYVPDFNAYFLFLIHRMAFIT